MKKIFFIFTAAILLAAGCNSQNEPASQSSSASNNTSPQVSHPESAPTGAEVGYENILNSVTAKCGNGLKILYFYTYHDSTKQPTDVYFFNAGTCGKENQLISVFYNRETQEISFSPVADNTANLKPFPTTDWLVSYQKATEAALAGDGQKFLNDNSGSKIKVVGLSYRPNESFRWEVLFNSADGSKKLSIYIDPRTGNIINK